MPQQSPEVRSAQIPPGAAWVVMWLCCSTLHFALMFALAVLLYTSPAGPIAGVVLALPATAIEWLLTATTGYQGEDHIQWPLIFANSLLYGAALAWLIGRWRAISASVARTPAGSAQTSATGHQTPP
jgi:hypothetical protein